jgi:hypothetical protein
MDIGMFSPLAGLIVIGFVGSIYGAGRPSDSRPVSDTLAENRGNSRLYYP